GFPEPAARRRARGSRALGLRAPAARPASDRRLSPARGSPPEPLPKPPLPAVSASDPPLRLAPSDSLEPSRRRTATRWNAHAAHFRPNPPDLRRHAARSGAPAGQSAGGARLHHAQRRPRTDAGRVGRPRLRPGRDQRRERTARPAGRYG